MTEAEKMQDDPERVDDYETIEDELDSFLLAIMGIHEKDCVAEALLDCNLRLAIICARIKEEGLPDESFKLMSLTLDALVKKTGVSVSEHVTPIQKGHIILRSDLGRIEKTIAGPISICLSVHLQFKRNLLAQQIKNFEAERNSVLLEHPINGQKIGPFDKKTLELVTKTMTMMLFPDTKHRALREKMSNVPVYNFALASDEKSVRLVKKRYYRIKIIGVVFKVQCEHWAVAQRRRSINIVMEAAAQGFFCEWEKINMNVGAAYKHWAEFKSVRHLLAADLALTWTDKQTNPGADKAGVFNFPFTSFISAPARFFLTADRYRQWALDAGLIKRKNELWMPKKWKTLIQEDTPPLEDGDIDPGYPDEIRCFDEFEKAYQDNKGWMK